MTVTINSRQARAAWSDLLQATRNGQRHIITISDIPVAALVPIADLRHLETPMPNDITTEYDPARAITAHALGLAQGDALLAIRLLGDAIVALTERAAIDRERYLGDHK